MNKIGKVILSIVWLLIIGAVIAPSQVPYADRLTMLGIALLVAHSIEIFIFRKLMRNIGDYFAMLVFGVLQLKSLKK
jgi:uncharacterized protein YhhL (DUF1145 family)